MSHTVIDNMPYNTSSMLCMFSQTSQSPVFSEQLSLNSGNSNLSSSRSPGLTKNIKLRYRDCCMPTYSIWYLQLSGFVSVQLCQCTVCTQFTHPHFMMTMGITSDCNLSKNKPMQVVRSTYFFLGV